MQRFLGFAGLTMADSRVDSGEDSTVEDSKVDSGVGFEHVDFSCVF